MAVMEHTFFLEYVPLKRVGLTKDQSEARQKVLLFLEGDCPQDIKDRFVETIKEFVSSCDNSSWVVGFIPAPDNTLTIIRYGDLALDLGNRTDCGVFLDLFYYQGNGKIEGFCVEKHRVEGKNVILIDAIFNSGNRYKKYSKMVMNAGAKSVRGIFVGKTTIQ